jgi:ABC-type polysaccharide/polyol phosphate transport system ATPase subunit
MSESTPAIECVGLTKSYELGDLASLGRTLAAISPRKTAPRDGFDALHDVNFVVPRGAFFGIVGANGSGKSTLTQVISGITVPTRGEARIRGRVLPLLEVGAGFHDELTGLENIYLLGAIIGLSRPQIAESIDAIVAFSGVQRHLDTPLKRYSSGMRARLSFATAICFPADIYVFDEVLAVVDDEFRSACTAELAKLNAAGRTIIFMSHDLNLVVDNCTTGIWLDSGEVRTVGSMEDVARHYAHHEEGSVPSAA